MASPHEKSPSPVETFWQSKSRANSGAQASSNKQSWFSTSYNSSSDDYVGYQCKSIKVELRIHFVSKTTRRNIWSENYYRVFLLLIYPNAIHTHVLGRGRDSSMRRHRRRHSPLQRLGRRSGSGDRSPKQWHKSLGSCRSHVGVFLF